MWREEIIGDARLILADCREVLPTLSGVDAVVTDPPYGIGWVRGNGGSRVPIARLPARRNGEAIIGDDRPFDPTPFFIFSEVMFFGAQHFANRLPIGRWHAWDKLNGWESHDTNSDVDFIWQNRRGASRIVRHLWKGVQRDSEAGPLHRRVHPSQKPIAVMEWCLGFINGKIILDPFMGSGTTGVACIRLGRRFIGIEVHEPYFNIACRRIEQAQRQGDLLNQLPPAEDPADVRMRDLFREPE